MALSMPTEQGDVKLTRTAQGMSLEMPGGEITGKIRMTVEGGTPPRLRLESPATTMKTFAQLLSVGVVDRPVVDMTELTGAYDIGVDLSAEDVRNVATASVNFAQFGGGNPSEARKPNTGEGASDSPGAAIYSSIQKLGLKLEPRKLPLDLLVIDHLEKSPSAN
jgi:uncharacterized protein (TIGR03435 family)